MYIRTIFEGMLEKCIVLRSTATAFSDDTIKNRGPMS